MEIKAQIEAMRQELEAGIADCLGDNPGASEIDAWHDIAVSIGHHGDYSFEARSAFCRGEGIPAPVAPALPTRAERKRLEQIERDRKLNDPANAEMLAKIRARRDEVRGLSRGRCGR